MKNFTYESESLEKLFGALCQVQQELGIAKTNASNPHYDSRYADFCSIVESSREILCKHGFCVIQRVLPREDKEVLQTRLCHSSGQWLDSEIILDPPKTNKKNDIQSLGSYITYLKRYGYAAICGIVVSGDDDDGEKAMKEVRKPYNSKISKDQLFILTNLLQGEDIEQDEEILNYILKGYKINKLCDLPIYNYEECNNIIKEKKQEVLKSKEI